MRILGIDLGSSSIKAVEIDSAFGRYEINDYYEHPVIAGTDPTMALVRMIQSLPKAPDQVAVAMPTSLSTFRNLKLPTRDRKSIQSGVTFELDDELPFPIEKAAYDYSILAQTKHEGTHLHVAASLKTTISKAIESWHSAGINPDLITTECWAYRVILSRILGKQEQPDPVLLIQIGNERTVLYVHWNGTPILARELHWGGRDLTHAIARKYNLSHEQAEQAKLDHGFVVPLEQRDDVSQEQIEFSETLLSVFQSLFIEIRQVELTCKNLTHHNISQAYAAGGSTLLPGLLRVLEETIRIPIRPLQSLSAIATSGVTYSEQTDAVFLVAAAAALCLVGPERGAAINFRKGDFSKSGKQAEFDLAMLKGPLMSAGAISASIIASLIFQTASYNKRLADINSQLDHGVKSFFGQISTSAIHTYLANPTTLKRQIKKQLDKEKDLAKLAGPNPSSPLDFLNSLSTAIPKDVITDLMRYQAGAAPGPSGTEPPYAPDGQQAATLVFLVPNQQTATKLESLLASRVAGLRKEKSESASGPDGTRQIRVTFTGTPIFSRGI